MSHNFRSRYSRKSIQELSKDTDFGLVSKTILSQNNGPMGVVQGQVKVAKKIKNTPTYSGPPSEPHTEYENHFFRFQAEDLLNPRMVWIAL